MFDGHGGRHAATFAAQNLGRHILAAMEKRNEESESLEDAMRDGYMALDSEFLAKVYVFINDFNTNSRHFFKWGN